MRYNHLGNSGIQVSAICLGTMTFGEQNTEEEGHHQLDCAIEHGINFIDTAELYAIPPKAETYGRTEEIIGSWLAKHGHRDDLVIAIFMLRRHFRCEAKKLPSDFNLLNPEREDDRHHFIIARMAPWPSQTTSGHACMFWKKWFTGSIF